MAKNLLHLIDCGIPSVSSDQGVVIERFTNATLAFHCEEGLLPDTTIEAVCGSTGVWSPNPANHNMCMNLSSAAGKQLMIFECIK